MFEKKKKTFKGGLGVVIGGSCLEHIYIRDFWDSKLNSVTVIRFVTNRVILIVNLYLIVDIFNLGLVPPKFFLWNKLFHKVS